MTLKVNGVPKEGRWFERDTSLLAISSVGTFATANWAVGGLVDQFIRVLETRGTILAISKEDDDTAHFIFGHASGLMGVDQGGLNVATELQTALVALVAGSTVTVGTGFTVI